MFGRKGRVERKNDSRAAFYFMLPSVLILTLFRILPIIVSVVNSTYSQSFTHGSDFVGLANYIYLFKDRAFWGSLCVTLLFTLLSNILIISSALLLANAFSSRDNLSLLTKGFLFFPSTLSCALVAIIWGAILDPNFGIANVILKTVLGKGMLFLSSPSQALITLIMMNLWHMVGYWMLFFIVGLNGIYKCYYDACDIEGASSFQKLIYITMPLMKRTISFVLVSLSVYSVTTFTQVYVLTQGGPMGATNMLAYDMYKRMFFSLDRGGAYAISTILLVMTLFIASREISKVGKQSKSNR